MNRRGANRPSRAALAALAVLAVATAACSQRRAREVEHAVGVATSVVRENPDFQIERTFFDEGGQEIVVAGTYSDAAKLEATKQAVEAALPKGFTVRFQVGERRPEITLENVEQLGQKATRRLGGVVRVSVEAGGCSGCSGSCRVELATRVAGRKVLVVPKGISCSCRGPCEAYWPGRGAATIELGAEADYTFFYPPGVEAFQAERSTGAAPSTAQVPPADETDLLAQELTAVTEAQVDEIAKGRKYSPLTVRGTLVAAEIYEDLLLVGIGGKNQLFEYAASDRRYHLGDYAAVTICSAAEGQTADFSCSITMSRSGAARGSRSWSVVRSR